MMGGGMHERQRILAMLTQADINELVSDIADMPYRHAMLVVQYINRKIARQEQFETDEAARIAAESAAQQVALDHEVNEFVRKIDEAAEAEARKRCFGFFEYMETRRDDETVH